MKNNGKLDPTKLDSIIISLSFLLVESLGFDLVPLYRITFFQSNNSTDLSKHFKDTVNLEFEHFFNQLAMWK